MRTVTTSPGVRTSVTYTYRSPGALRSVHLVCPAASAAPARGAPGVGDRRWLLETPFLAAGLAAGAHQSPVVFGVAAEADAGAVGELCLRGLADHALVAVSEADAALVAAGMRLPLMVVTGADADGVSVVYRRPAPDL